MVCGKVYDPYCHVIVDFDHFPSHASSSNQIFSKHYNILSNQNLIYFLTNLTNLIVSFFFFRYNLEFLFPEFEVDSLCLKRT